MAPVLKVIQTILTIASIAYQRNQYKKMKREQDKRRGMRVTIRGESQSIPVIYGRQMLGGIEVKHHVSPNYTYATENANAVIFDKGLGTSNVTGTKHEFLYVQSAICQDGIEGIQFVNIDGKPYNLDNEDFKHRIVVNNSGGTAENLATANGLPATNRFTGCAFATAVYRLNREEPQYNGIPTTEFFVKGRKVRSITQNAGTYSLSSTYTFSNNPALCLLDYMLNSDFGKGLTVNDIDLETFYNAAQICDTTVLTGVSAFGHIHGFKPVLDFDTQSDFPDVGEEAYLYQATDTGQLYSWSNSGGNYSTYSTTSNVRNVPLYECNITLDTSAKIRDNIEAILQTMGLAELTWSSEGKYKLLLEYPTTQTELNNLIDSDHQFDDDSIIRDSIELNWTPLNDRFNHVTVRFLNEHEDFREDSKSWPPKTGSVYSTYYAEDNNQLLSTELTFEGCSDPYHALAKAEQTVRQSREMYSITLRVNKQGLTLEPGDFFSVSITDQNITNEIFRVESIEVNEDLTCSLSGYHFDTGFLAWNVADNESYATRVGVETKILGPSQITATDTGFVNDDGIFLPAVELNWTASDDSSVRSYELQYKVSTDTNYSSYRTTQLSHVVTGLKTGTQYTFRVRAVSNTGRFSEFATVTHTVGGDTTAPGIPTGLTATGHFKYVSLEWTNPADADLAFIEIYENTSNSTSGGTLVGTTRGDTFTRANLGLNQLRYYYIRAVDNTGNTSAFTSVVSATTTYLDDPDFANGIYSLFTSQGLYAIEDVTGLPASGTFTGEKVFNRNDGKLYQWTGTQWDQVVGGAEDFADLTGTIAGSQIPSGAITEAKLGSNSVTSAKISANAVGANEIAANAITAAKISSGTITGDKISANTITGGLLATSGIITNSAQINNSVITNAAIQNATIQTAKIGNNMVTFPSLATGSSLTDIAKTTTTESQLVSLSVSGSGAMAQVTGYLVVSTVNSGGSGVSMSNWMSFNIYLRQSGSNIAGLNNAYIGAINSPAIIFSAQVFVSGSATFTLSVQNTGNGGGNAAFSRFIYPRIQYLELKR
jgi:hypothetical protein